jgi:CheY-like chemotaxis protein
MTLHSRVVLVVDPSPATSDLYAEFLRRDPATLVLRASTCEGALQLCEGIRPNVVVTDLHLKMDGERVFCEELIKALDPGVRIVAVSAHPGTPCPPGIHAVVEAPVDPQRLLSAVSPTWTPPPAAAPAPRPV